MKFSSLSAIASLAVSFSSSSVVAAANTGAAYFISNEPSGNYIIAADIAADGTLSLGSATYAGGLGLNGVEGVPLPAPLFSTTSVAVNNKAGLLAAVNPGSDTVALFGINPQDPTSIRSIGAPIGSGGDFPVSAAFNSIGTRLCVLNGGAVNSVQCFDTTDSQRGLRPIAGSWRALGLNQTTPPAGPAGSASQVLFSTDDSTLYVAAKGGSPGNSAFIASWPVASDGSLGRAAPRVGTPGIGPVPFALSNVAGQSGAIFVVDAFVGAEVVNLGERGAAVAATGAATATAKIPGVGAVCWVAYSPRTGAYYVTDLLTNLITEFKMNGLSPSVAKQYTTQPFAGAADVDIASLANSDYLYVNLPNATSIAVYNLAGPGKAQKIQTLEVSQPTANVGVKLTGANISGMTVYVAPQSA